MLSYRAISFWLPTPLGGVAYFQLRRTVARWRDEQSGPAAPTARGPAVGAAGAVHG